MNDKEVVIAAIGILYAAFVLLAIVVTVTVPTEFERHPGLIDRKWKRILWVLGCILLLPLLMIAMRGPISVWTDIEAFITSGCGGQDNNEQDQMNLFD